MSYYNLPGASDLTPINDLRGDGLEGDDHNYAEFVQEQFGADKRVELFGADQFDEEDPVWDGLGADELIMLGWDPFKAVKKAVKSAAKVTGQVTSVVTKPLAKVVSKVPIVGKVGASAIRATGALANPLAFTDPKKLISAQLTVAKNSLNLAKQAVKSPVVKSVALGAAIVFPPIGIPAAAALATAAAVAAGVDSAKSGVRQAARQIVDNTATLARFGDKGAQIALAEIATQKQALVARRLAPPSSDAKRLVFDVFPGGRISSIAV
jgi:hypothetical protein